MSGIVLPEEDTCFLACTIGEDPSPERKWSDYVLKCVEDALEGLYKVTRGERLHAGPMIDDSVISSLIESRLVVAELTDRNPNVYYELGVRAATGRPFICLCGRSQRAKLPFDVNHYRVIDLPNPPKEYGSDLLALDRDGKAAVAALRSMAMEFRKDPSTFKSPVKTKALFWSSLSSSPESEMLRSIDDKLDRIEGFIRSSGVIGARSASAHPQTDLDVAASDALHQSTKLMDAERFPEAIRLLEAALRSEPDNLAILQALAEALAGDGRDADARVKAVRALEIDPNFECAKEILSILDQRRSRRAPAESRRRAQGA